MSPIDVGGPALFLGADTPCVALLRPEIDPGRPEVREAAERAGVTPEEFAGPSGLWQLIADRTDGEGLEVALPEFGNAAAADFADRLLAALDDRDAEFTEALTVSGSELLRLNGRPAGAGFAFLARLTPPESAPLDVEIGPTSTADLRAELELFRRNLG